MKILEVQYNGVKATVLLEPNWLEKLFGKKPVVRFYYYQGRNLVFGNYRVWFDEYGNRIGGWPELDAAILANKLKDL